MRKKYGIELIIMGLLIFTLALNAQPQSTFNQVTATGMATIFAGDQGLARDQAIDDALRNAVEQGLGTFVQSSTLVENYQLVSDNILTWSKGYVKNYQIISERLPDPTTYEVVINAQLEIANLKNDWDSVQNMIGKMQNPRILIIMDEQNIGQSYDKYHFLAVDMTISEATLINKFLEKGFECIDAATMRENVKQEQAYAALTGNSQVAAQLGKNLGAEIIVTGKAVAKVATGINLGGMKSCQANLTARVIKADIASVIATSSQHAAYPHIDEVTGGTKAIEKAAEKLGNDLINKIAEKWRDEFYNATTVKVIVHDVDSFSEINDFKSSLKYYVRGIKDVYQRNFSAGLAELDVKITGNADQLARELERKDFDKFNIKVKEASMNRIVLSIQPKQQTN
ncbi:flagellar assembly protein T N-terminal domain-containing protein [candidate division KSB1 bacterium]|nr:flagellar assembly protein T N-terminal domain-containing protein [candidate division KSB1 bacterium]